MSRLSDEFARRWSIAKEWFRDGKPLWRWLFIANLIFWSAYFFPVERFDFSAEFADRLRWAGMIFQFAGLATVVWGLNESRKLFNRQPIWKAACQWLGRIRFIFKPSRAVGRTFIFPVSGGLTMTGHAAALLVKGGTLENRVARLEAGQEDIKKDISTIRGEIADQTNKAYQRIDLEKSDRETGDQRSREQLETATIGGISLEISGLAYLSVGILLTSVPSELASLLQKLGL